MSDSISRKIAAYEEQYGVIDKAIVDVIWVVDIETMRFSYISPSVESATGYTAEEIQRMPIKTQLAPNSHNKAMDYLAEGHRKFKLGKSVKRKMEFELRHKNGSPYWVEITAKFFKGDHGRTQLFGVMRNITRQHALEIERDELIGKLEEALSQQKVLEAENEMLRGLLPICASCKKSATRMANGGRWKSMSPCTPRPIFPIPSAPPAAR